ncbi:MAG: DUF1778 domain-containing protein [Methylococcales bacterium]
MHSGILATANQFLVHSALKEAQAVIEHEEFMRLSPRDWSWLLELMENPPQLNAKLQAAMKHYQDANQNDADNSFNWGSCSTQLRLQASGTE